jgi:UDP:flavonoid glycosyltransferase YjiC (YdhE family)
MRILLAWELGAGYGHLAALRALARLLREQRHELLFAVRELETAGEFLEPGLGPVLQAPVRLGAGRNPVQTQFSYASLLHNIGFDDPVGLAARLGAWRALLIEWRAERLIAHHAPIALLAAATLGIPAVALGSGFELPPLAAPFPSFQPELNVTHEVLVHNDTQVLAELNLALQRLGLPPQEQLQALFAQADRGLLSYPELDHYELARQEPFLGLPDFSLGAAPPWPDGAGPRVFAYLRPYASLKPLMQGLSASKARVLVRVAGVALDKLRPFLRPGLAICASAVHLRQAAESCDAYVHYAAHGTVAEMLLAGKPGLLWPGHHEQTLVARRARQLGAAVVIANQGAPDVAGAMKRLLQDESLRRAAEGFAARHRAQDRSLILPQLLQRALA